MFRLSTVLGGSFAILIFASQLWLFRHFSIDDAFITFRYVRQFVAGNGLVFNIGERVEGYSNFLWLMLLAPLHALGLDLLLAARLLAIALSIGTLLLTYQLARNNPHPILAPIVLASCAPFAAWTMGGLETPLFCFLLTASAYAFVREEERGRGFASGILFGLLALTRPEGLMFALVAIGFRALSNSKIRMHRNDWLRVATFGAIVTPYFVWRLSYYGYLLPNTIYAKSMGLHPRALIEGAYYLYESAVAIGGLWFVAVPVAFTLLKSRTLRNMFLLACVGAYASFIVVGGGDWMPMQRFLVHVLPLIVVLAHAGLILLTNVFTARWQAIIATALALGQSTFLFFGALDARFVQGVGQPIAPQGVTMVEHLRANVKAGDVIAVTDAGGIAYALPLDARVVDMFGLTDAHIARLQPQFPGGLLGRGDGFGKWDVDYVLAQNPRFIQVHVIGRAQDGTFIVDNTSNRLLVNDPRFKEQYQQVADTLELQGLFERIP